MSWSFAVVSVVVSQNKQNGEIFFPMKAYLCSCNNLVTKQLYCDIKLKQEPGTALSLTKNGLSAD